MINTASPDYSNTPVSPERPAYPYLPANRTEPAVVTIVTPIFNVAVDIFKETARSIQQQSLQQWEWVIVNDGSTRPETLESLSFFRNAGPRYRVIDHPTNQGPGAARNTGFRNARADYVVILDGDDLLEPTTIEKWFWFLYTHPHISFTQGYSVRFGHDPHLWSRSFEQGPAFLLKNQMDITAMIRRGVWEAVQGFDETLREGLEDWDFWLRCAAKGYWGIAIPEYHNWYRLRPRHTTRWPAWHKGTKMLAVQEKLQQRYPQLHEERFPTISRTLVSSIVSLNTQLPCQNLLTKSSNSRRVIVLFSEPPFEFEKSYLFKLLPELLTAGYELSMCTFQSLENSGLAKLTRFTPDVFVLPNFLEPTDYPRFLRYMINSRRIDLVLMTGDIFAYRMLPFLRAFFPEATYVSYLWAEESQAGKVLTIENVRCHQLLDLIITSTESVRNWLVENGCEYERVVFCPVDHLSVGMADSWIKYLERACRLSVSLPRLTIDPNLGQLWAELVLETAHAQRPDQPSVQQENVIDLLSTISGEELGWLVPIRKLIKAFGFKLATQPGFRWLYYLRGFGKRLLGH